MSHTPHPGLIRRLFNHLGPNTLPPGARSVPAPVPDAGREEMPPETPVPAGERSPLFAVRDHALPGQEYAHLLRIPEALDPAHRRAHLLAVRGLMHARQARHEAAGQAFREALALNPHIDLAALPTFWDLPRAGCEAAVFAYRDAGLAAEATTLNARLRQSLRPRLLPVPPEPRIRRAN